MKKIFASVLALVMVLALASTAMAAFSWNAGSSTTSESFASRYKIEVVKLANETGIIGTNKMIEAPGATAVNNASVYFYIRLTVSGSNTSDPDDVQEQAEADVSFTALKGVEKELKGFDASIAHLTNGVYYLDAVAGEWNSIDKVENTFAPAVIEARVLDTATAKVSAKVSSSRDLKYVIESDGYKIAVTSKTEVTFSDPDTAANEVTFTRDESTGKVTAVTVASGASANFVDKLYTFLGFRAADVESGKIYMSDANIKAAFGFDYKGESSATWNANTTAIILDPAVGVGIPKTGDNTSVIGFALVMLALVGAAVAVKKVKA